MAGNQPDRARNTAPQPDRGPQGAPHGDDNTSGYDEKKPTSVSDRDAPDPTVAGAQPEPQDPDDPDINQPIPPGDVPSKTPVKEPERGVAEYVDDTPNVDQAQFGDAARPIVPGPADGAD